MRAALTGATGFIGTHLTVRLVAEGIATRVLARRPAAAAGLCRAVTGSGEPSALSVIAGDLTDDGALRELVAGCDVVFHIAGLTRAPTEAALHDANAGGTVALVDTLDRADAPGTHLILVSSQAAVGPALDATAVDELTPARPISRYGRSKRAAERVVTAAARRGRPVSIIRPPSVYGPGDRDILVYFKLASRGVVPVLRGEAPLSVLYVHNLVDALLAAAQLPPQPAQLPPQPRVLHMADDDDVTMAQLGEMIAASLGASPRRVVVPRPLLSAAGLLLEAWGQLSHTAPLLNRDKLHEMRQPAWLLASRRSREALRYRPRVATAAAVAATARWYLAHRWL